MMQVEEDSRQHAVLQVSRDNQLTNKYSKYTLPIASKISRGN